MFRLLSEINLQMFHPTVVGPDTGTRSRPNTSHARPPINGDIGFVPVIHLLYNHRFWRVGLDIFQTWKRDPEGSLGETKEKSIQCWIGARQAASQSSALPTPWPPLRFGFGAEPPAGPEPDVEPEDAPAEPAFV